LSCFSPSFFRSLKSSNKNEKGKLSVRTDWLEEIYIYLKNYIDFPEVNKPSLDKFHTNEKLSQESIEEIANTVRRHWGLGFGPISNVTLLLEKNGFLITRNPVKSDKIDAFSKWSVERPFVYLSSDKNCAVRTRFDIAHELGHLLLHIEPDQERFNNKEYLDNIEREANKFAGAFLLPRDTFGEEVLSTSIHHFIALKRRWKVSIQAMICRCEDLGILSESQILYLRKQISKNRMRSFEPLDDELIPENPVVFSQAINLIIDKKFLLPSQIIEDLSLPIEEVETLTNVSKGTLTKEGQIIQLKLKNINIHQE